MGRLTSWVPDLMPTGQLHETPEDPQCPAARPPGSKH